MADEVASSSSSLGNTQAAEHSFDNAIPRTKAPLRLIDIAGTLANEDGVCFCNPNSWPLEKRWDFHVLSHTWSKLLKDFSKKIGENAAYMGLTSSENYNEAFKNARLQSEACYQEFMRVLELLRGDGVEYVWYDMLCINQSDGDKETGEKAQEIPYMASYYHYNKGCYVLLHGVGQGYKLWNKPPRSIGAACNYWKGSQPSIPRWFTRVWTFQEYVLPSRLIFIVEGLERSTKAHLNHFIRKFSKFAHDPNLLMMCCCIATKSRFIDVERYKNQLLHMAVDNQQRQIRATLTQQDDEEEEVLGACDHTRACRACGITEPLIRKVKDKENLYFVNGKSYLLLVDLDWGESGLHQKEFLNTLLHSQLLADNFSYQVGRIAWVLQEISKRDCTVDEDRVLSILGLLQVGGDKQVRTHKSLEAQLLILPPKLHPKILLQLCLASPEGGFYNEPGLSWAPNLTVPHIKESLFDFDKFPLPIFVEEKDVQMVSACGSLKFRGKIAKGKIVPLRRRHIISHKHLPISCFFCKKFRDHPYSSLALHQIAQCQLEVGNKLKLPLDVHFFFVHNKGGSQALHKAHIGGRLARGLVDVGDSWFASMREEDFEDDYEVKDSYNCSFTLNLPNTLCAHNLAPFDVWLLHMGRSQSGVTSTNFNLLLCLGTDAASELHKLGTLSLSQGLWDMALNFNKDPLKECTLGGFGTHNVRKLWEVLAKPPYKCYSCARKLSSESFLMKI